MTVWIPSEIRVPLSIVEDYREFDHLFEKFGKEWVDKGDRRKACLEIVARLENLKMEEREGMEAMRS